MPWERVAKARAVRQNEVGLKFRKPLVRDPRVGEQAESGVDSVDRVAARDDALHGGRGLVDAPHRCVVEPRLDANPQLPQVV